MSQKDSGTNQHYKSSVFHEEYNPEHTTIKKSVDPLKAVESRPSPPAPPKR